MLQNLKIINTNHALPFELSMIKSFLRIEHSSDDEFLIFLAFSVAEYAEDILEIAIGKKEYEFQTQNINGTITLPRKGEIEVLSVKIEEKEVPFKIYSNKLQTQSTSKTVTVSFTCENQTVPESVQLAMLRHMFFIYETRSLSPNEQDVRAIYQNLIPNNYKL